MIVSENSGFVITVVKHKSNVWIESKVVKITIVSDLTRLGNHSVKTESIRSSLDLGMGKRVECWWGVRAWLAGAQKHVAAYSHFDQHCPWVSLAHCLFCEWSFIDVQPCPLIYIFAYHSTTETSRPTKSKIFISPFIGEQTLSWTSVFIYSVF